MLKDTAPVLNRLKDLGRERDELMATLALWKVVEDAGIDIDRVKTFTFRPEFLTSDQLRTYMRGSFEQRKQVCREWHNCVRLDDDTLAPFPLSKSPRCVS